MSGITQVSTNIIRATVTPFFSFYQYMVECSDKNGKAIDQRFRRADLFRRGLYDNILQGATEVELNDWKRVIAFQGSYFFSGRRIPGLEPESIPMDLATNDNGDVVRCVGVNHWKAPDILQATPSPTPAGDVALDSTRCGSCTACFANNQTLLQHLRDAGHQPVLQQDVVNAVSATNELFTAYVNIFLHRAFEERLQRWGRHFIDPSQGHEERGCIIYPAYDAQFGLQKIHGKPSLVLTLDLRAKVIRNRSLLDEINPGGSSQLTAQDQRRAQQKWVGEVIIYKREKRCEFWSEAWKVSTAIHG